MIPINEIYQGDCLEWMEYIDDKSIDMILCDLPYGVAARCKWDNIISMDKLWLNYKKIIKDNGIIILTATEPFASYLISTNLPLFKYDLIWSKPLATGFLNAKRMPLRNHENILIFYKKLPVYNPQKTNGKPYKMKRRAHSPIYNKIKDIHREIINKDGKRFPKSILEFSRDSGKSLHPTQKPVKLFKYLIKTYTNENDLVLDNCIGSGTTAIACLETNRNYIGIELEEKCYSIAINRVKEYKRRHNK